MKYAALIVIAVLVLASVLTVSISFGFSKTTTVTQAQPLGNQSDPYLLNANSGVEPYTYLIWTGGTCGVGYYCAKNGINNTLAYGGPNNAGGISGTNFAQVLVASAANGGLIQIASGNFSISSLANLSSSNIIIRGAGRSQTFIVGSGGSLANFIKSAGKNNITISDLTIKGGSTTITDAALNVYGGNFLTISGVSIINPTWAATKFPLRFCGTGGPPGFSPIKGTHCSLINDFFLGQVSMAWGTNIIVSGSTFEMDYSTAPTGASMLTANFDQNMTIVNDVFNQNLMSRQNACVDFGYSQHVTMTGLVGYCGLYGESNSSDIAISGGTFIGGGIDIEGANGHSPSYVSVSGTTIMNSGFGFYLKGLSQMTGDFFRGLSVSAVTVVNSRNASMYLEAVKDFSITGSTFINSSIASNHHDSDIELGGGCNDFSITGNTFYSSASNKPLYGINEQSTNGNITIVGNNFYNGFIHEVTNQGIQNIAQNIGHTMIPFNQAVGGSPYTYTNDNPYPVLACLAGGNVTYLTVFGSNNIANVGASGRYTGCIYLVSLSFLVITYIGTPTLIIIPQF